MFFYRGTEKSLNWRFIMKEITFEEMEMLKAGQMSKWGCAAAGFATVSSLFGGPMLWGAGAFALGMAIEGGCFD